MQKARYVVQNSHSNVGWEVLEECLEEKQHVVLLLARRCHIDEEKDSVVATEETHEPGVVEKLGAGFLAGFVCSFE